MPQRPPALKRERARLVAWIISAALAAVAGALYAHFVLAILPAAFYFQMTFLLVTMVILGGYSVTGAVVGSVVVTILAEALRRAENGISIAGFQLTEAPGLTGLRRSLACTIVLILTLRPQGMLGRWEIDELLARLFVAASSRRPAPIKTKPKIAAWPCRCMAGKRRTQNENDPEWKSVSVTVVALLAAAAMGVPALAELEACTVDKIGWAADLSNYLSFVDGPLDTGMTPPSTRSTPPGALRVRSRSSSTRAT